MKFTVGILIAFVLFLVWRLNVEIELNRQQQSHVAELTLKLSDKSAHENIEMQKNCSQQAGAIFLQLGYKNGGLDSYQSHYNTKLNKCFILVHSIQGTTVSKFLLDAYEQRSYAYYMWMADKGKKYWEVPPVICALTPLSEDESSCNSEGEYNTFVARYME